MKTQNPVVSIILLSLLRQSCTERCLKSLLHHTTGPFEIIIVDMGKSEKIVGWLSKISQKHRNISVIFNKDNVGVSIGRNQGIRQSRGKYIVFLDNDAWVTKNWLKPLIECVESKKEIGACGAKIIYKNNTIKHCSEYVKASFKNNKLISIGLDYKRVFKKGALLPNRIKEVPWYPTACLLVKRKALNSIGGFNENLFMAEEDKDLSLSLRKKGFGVFYSPRSSVYHDNNKSHSSYKLIRYDVQKIARDIKNFESKWRSKVFINYSVEYLKEMGFSDKQIALQRQYSLFSTIND